MAIWEIEDDFQYGRKNRKSIFFKMYVSLYTSYDIIHLLQFFNRINTIYMTTNVYTPYKERNVDTSCQRILYETLVCKLHIQLKI